MSTVEIMMLPRKERELQDAIGLRFRMVQVTERRERLDRLDRRVNGPDRSRLEPRPRLFLVTPEMKLARRTERKPRRGMRPLLAPPLQPQTPRLSNLIQMPSRGVAKPNDRRHLQLGAAAAMGPLAWLGHALLSLIRLR